MRPRLRTLYVLAFAFPGAMMPHLAPYLRGRGLTGTQIGAMEGLPWIAGAVGTLAWARWADRSGKVARTLRLASGGAALVALLLPFASSPWLFGAVLVTLATFDRALVPLLDATSQQASRSGAATFASLRAFGPLGFPLAALTLGAALSWRGDRPADPLVPAVLAMLLVAFAAAAWRLPEPATPGTAPRSEISGSFRAVLSRPYVLLLLACAFHWAASAPYHVFFGVLARTSGLPSWAAGLGMAIAALSEVPAFAAYDRLERRLSPVGVLGLAFAGGAVRWLLMTVASGWLLLGAQALQGLSFALFISAALTLVRLTCPATQLATATAVFYVTVMGLVNAGSSLAAGVGVDHYGEVRPLFFWCAAAELVALVTLTLVGRRVRTGEAPAR